MYIHTYTLIHIDTHICTHSHTHEYINTLIHTRTLMLTQSYRHTDTHSRSHTHRQTDREIHTHTHMIAVCSILTFGLVIIQMTGSGQMQDSSALVCGKPPAAPEEGASRCSRGGIARRKAPAPEVPETRLTAWPEVLPLFPLLVYLAYWLKKRWMLGLAGENPLSPQIAAFTRKHDLKSWLLVSTMWPSRQT